MVTTWIISLSHMRGLADVFFHNIVSSSREVGGPPVTHRGYTIVSIPAASAEGRIVYCVGHVNNSFVISTHVAGVHLAIDRLLSNVGNFGGRENLAKMYAQLDTRQDILGVVSSDNGQIRRFLQGLANDQDGRERGRITPQFIDAAADAVDQIGWEVDVLSQDQLTVHVVFECRSPEAAERVRLFVDQLAREASSLAKAEPARVNGKRVELGLHVSNLQRLLGAESK